MQRKKNILVPFLIGSSIVLLLVFQYFWLRSEYRNAEDSFQKETNLVFKNTVSQLLDSLYISQVDLLKDSLGVTKRTIVRPGSSERIDIQAISKALKFELGTAVMMTRDSIDSTAFSSILPERRKERMNSFMIRINPDSLEVSSITMKYSNLLKEIGRDVPFDVLIRNDSAVGATETAFTTEFIRIGPGSEVRYAASFDGVRPLLLKEIYPQILFSVILTLITLAAFIIMYKNLQAQKKLVIQKNDFISNVSHELKTPIATVNVALEAFKNFKALDDTKMTNEYLDIVKTELDRLSAMTDKILNASVYDSKGIDITLEEIDLKVLIISIFKTMEPIWEKDNINAGVSFEGNEFTFYGGRLHITNVLYNLLDNAVKYSRGKKEIMVRLKETDTGFIITVTDKGIGIPEEYRKKIFEKFFRVPHGDIHNVKGYGLGLSYVAQVIKAHKGKIEVSSELGQGSVFHINLPKNAQD